MKRIGISMCRYNNWIHRGDVFSAHSSTVEMSCCVPDVVLSPLVNNLSQGILGRDANIYKNKNMA